MAPYHNLALRYVDCAAGYQWYTCQRGGQSYAGCCSVDPCALPGFCPVDNREGSEEAPASTSTRKVEPVTVVLTSTTRMTLTTTNSAANPTFFVTTATTETAATETAITSPNAAVAQPTAVIPVSSAPTTTAAQAEGHKSSGIPMGAAVAVAVGALIVAVLAALCVWGRWRRKNKNERRKAKKGKSRGSPDSEKGSRVRSRGTSSPPSPTHVFDEFGGMSPLLIANYYAFHDLYGGNC